MKMRNSTVFAWLAVAAAVAAWTAVFMYSAWIRAQLDVRVAQTAGAQSVSEREMAAVRLHSLARDTQSERTQLDGLMHADVIGIADTIDSVGKIAGVTIKIGGATPELAKRTQGTAGAPVLQAVGFVVEADGTFSSLMHATALLETLPTLSSVQSLEFEHALSSGGSATGAAWHLTARIRMVTTADISS